MNFKSRLTRLENKKSSRPNGDGLLNLNFRVAGKPRSWVQEESIRRLRQFIADPRATDVEREAAVALIGRLEYALVRTLEGERMYDHGTQD